MTTLPQFISLEPFVLDYNRVTLNLKTINLPSVSNVSLNFDPAATPTSPLPGNSKDTPPLTPDSPYPNVELNLFDQADTPVAQVTIIEHKERNVALTLHLRRPKPGASYTARADMVYGNEIIHSLSAPFVLNISNVGAEK